jgi:cytidyltransferase-like protein
MDERKIIIAIASGYFNPIHIGHIELFKKAKEIADKLIVIVNNDEQRKLKGSKEFQSQNERCEIVESLKPVDSVLLSIDTDKTVRESLKLLYEKYKSIQENPAVSSKCRYQLIFINGGDQFSNTIAEADVCREYGIYMIDGLGEKIQSSSWLLENEK